MTGIEDNKKYQMSGGKQLLCLDNGKGNKNVCNNYKGISLLSVMGKVYGSVVTG